MGLWDKIKNIMVISDEDDYEDDDDFDHLADPEELERRAALRRGQYTLSLSSEGAVKKEEEEEEEEEDFGDFESADDQSQTWDMLSNNMETMKVNNDIVRAIKTKEEEEHLKQKKDYQHEEEQEGEV